MIYFVQCGAGRGPVKIGLAETRADCERRLRTLQTGNHEDLYLIAAMGGDLTRERELHARFKEGHIRGEWFRWDTPALQDLISAALDEQILVDSGFAYCEQCGINIVKPPRRKLCGPECERQKKRKTGRVWKKLNPSSDIPLVGSDASAAETPLLQGENGV